MGKDETYSKYEMKIAKDNDRGIGEYMHSGIRNVIKMYLLAHAIFSSQPARTVHQCSKIHLHHTLEYNGRSRQRQQGSLHIVIYSSHSMFDNNSIVILHLIAQPPPLALDESKEALHVLAYGLYPLGPAHDPQGEPIVHGINKSLEDGEDR
jgi:hypothetical protein